MTEADALAFLSEHSDLDSSVTDVERDRAFIVVAYRQAAKKLHPDAGGNAEQFKRLQEAMRVLGGDT